MGWAFIYLMLVLKIPIAALLYIVWWAIRSEPETTETSADDNGGTKARPRRHPPKPFPRRPRRGPHGDPLPLPPPRTRAVVARARRVDHA
jgi:hypothetical protein